MSTQIRHDHPHGFRSGQWGYVIDVVLVERDDENRLCYAVGWDDGVIDTWPVYNDQEKYYSFRKVTA